jgi:hypothetical protein
MFRKALTVTGAALAVLLGLFHAWLFASQAIAGRLDDPGRLLRWMAAFGLVAALVLLHRRGIPMLRGRQAAAVWTLAALLHAPAIGERMSTMTMPAVPEAVETLAPAVAAFAALLLSTLIVRVTAAAPAAWHATGVPSTVARRIVCGDVPRFSPRPPPQA